MSSYHCQEDSDAGDQKMSDPSVPSSTLVECDLGEPVRRRRGEESPLDQMCPTTPRRAVDFQFLPRLLTVHKRLIPMTHVDFEEPTGTVGKYFRLMFMKYYGTLLSKPVVKAAVVLCFLGFLCFGVYNVTAVRPGLMVREITPYDSYLREFYDVRERYFSTYGDECVVVFPNAEEWWKPSVQETILNLTRSIRHSGHVVLAVSGLEEFLLSYEMSRKATKEEFMQYFFKFLESPRGEAYKSTFSIENGVLTSWKFYYW